LKLCPWASPVKNKPGALRITVSNLDNPVDGGPETSLVTVLVSVVLLVLFHPRAVHSLYDDPRDDVAECKAYALRSPHPTFHLLRQKDILAGVTGGMPSPELIPERNSARLQKMGIEALRKIWGPLLPPAAAPGGGINLAPAGGGGRGRRRPASVHPRAPTPQPAVLAVFATGRARAHRQGWCSRRFSKKMLMKLTPP